MLRILFHAHSGLRYLVLLAGVAALVYFAVGLATKRPVTKAVRILGPTRIGAHGTPIFFLHPKDMGGVLTEIMESPKQAH